VPRRALVRREGRFGGAAPRARNGPALHGLPNADAQARPGVFGKLLLVVPALAQRRHGLQRKARLDKFKSKLKRQKAKVKTQRSEAFINVG
jgi:hypothetical protein